MSNIDLITGADDQPRCWWCGADADYVAYHDTEWGRPVADDRRLFEKICLEGFQAGLSWLTILRKRDAFREAFADFDFEAVARYKSREINRLLKNADIVRHRGKIEATINNASQAIKLCDEFGSLAGYFWQFEAERSEGLAGRADVVAVTAESQSLSRDLKGRGWKFVGPTTCYAFMQAMGLVNDHLHGCVHFDEVKTARRKFKRPQV